MKSTKVTAVFDIGKTNKKFFLFDSNYKEIYRDYTRLPETVDEDGFPAEDISLLKKWIKTTFDAILEKKVYNVKAVNFSSYGASFVHLDHQGNVLTPLYNYTKSIEKSVSTEFYEKYGDELSIAVKTASPQSGFLNSGMQLFWLKKTKPEIYNQIKYSLHLPQYLSYLFTGISVSEYTSIGCHTNLWDYEQKDYHHWVYEEQIDKILSPIVPTSTSIQTLYKGKKLKIGIGIHDSSSALLPYILSKKKPFLLLSTGTWSIAMNPFSKDEIKKEDLKHNCFNYLRVDGNPVKASRFFMGNEYRLQVEKLGDYYQKEYGYHRDVKFNKDLYLKLIKNPSIYFKFEGISLQRKKLKETDLESFNSFEEAFHQLMIELMELQLQTIRKAIGNSDIKKIYIDGGFTDNDVFMKMMSHHFSEFEILSTQSPLGSALGAAMVISDKKVKDSFLKENYRMKKLIPLLIK